MDRKLPEYDNRELSAEVRRARPKGGRPPRYTGCLAFCLRSGIDLENGYFNLRDIG